MADVGMWKASVEATLPKPSVAIRWLRVVVRHHAQRLRAQKCAAVNPAHHGKEKQDARSDNRDDDDRLLEREHAPEGDEGHGDDE